MNVAIVGTSIDLTTKEMHSIEILCRTLIESYKEKITVLSGGAKGVDSIANQVAQDLRMDTKVYNPKKQSWKFFKKRNLQLANDCDELYCITIPTRFSKCYHHDPPLDHQKTAGCWTMNEAILKGKKCKLIII